MPKRCAVARIESKEVPFPSASKDQVGGSAEDTTFGEVDHLVLPFLLAGLGDDCDQSTIAFLFRLEIRGVAVAARRKATAALRWTSTSTGQPSYARIPLAFFPNCRGLG